MFNVVFVHQAQYSSMRITWKEYVTFLCLGLISQTLAKISHNSIGKKNSMAALFTQAEFQND